VTAAGERTGRVSAFDATRGLGAIVADDGTRLEFHCTQIADGSRTIPVGTPVRFKIAPGHLGKWEAVAITPV
jgi:cold shock CspA family protein